MDLSAVTMTDPAGHVKYALGPGLFRRLFFGAGSSAVPTAGRLVTPGGGLMQKTIEGLYKGPTLKSMWADKSLKGVGSWAKDVTWGTAPVTVLKQRLAQGGVFGKGGVLRGTLAPSKEFGDEIARHGLGKAILHNPGKALGYGVGTGFTLGFPAYGVASDISSGDYKHIPMSIASGLAWPIAEPFGLAMQLPVQMGAESMIGSGIKSGLSSAEQSIRNVFKPKVESFSGATRSLAPPRPKIPKISPYNFA